jgi:hypothetical protein
MAETGAPVSETTLARLRELARRYGTARLT